MRLHDTAENSESNRKIAAPEAKRLVDHPQLQARGRWREIQTPAGPIEALVPPADIEGVESVMGAVPGLGEHTDSVLGELGYDGATIAAWRAAGIV